MDDDGLAERRENDVEARAVDGLLPKIPLDVGAHVVALEVGARHVASLVLLGQVVALQRLTDCVQRRWQLAVGALELGHLRRVKQLKHYAVLRAPCRQQQLRGLVGADEPRPEPVGRVQPVGPVLKRQVRRKASEHLDVVAALGLDRLEKLVGVARLDELVHSSPATVASASTTCRLKALPKTARRPVERRAKLTRSMQEDAMSPRNLPLSPMIAPPSRTSQKLLRACLGSLTLSGA